MLPANWSSFRDVLQRAFRDLFWIFSGDFSKTFSDNLLEFPLNFLPKSLPRFLSFRDIPIFLTIYKGGIR